jgi:hypothetical protein
MTDPELVRELQKVVLELRIASWATGAAALAALFLVLQGERRRR